MSTAIYAIKFRRRCDKAWHFVRTDGNPTRLKVWAATWDSATQADIAVGQAAMDPRNAHLEFKVVKWGERK